MSVRQYEDDNYPSAEEAVRKAQAEAQAAREAARPAVHGSASPKELRARESLGAGFVDSPAYLEWSNRFPSGGPTQEGNFMGAGHVVRTGIPNGVFRALITAADASAGSLVRPDRAPIEPGIVRPLTIRDLVTILNVTSDQVDFPRETSRTSAAAPVTEATALTGTSGTKPEGGFVFELVTVGVKTIAVWVPATKRIVSDAAFLRAYIDAYVTQDLSEEVEDQMIAGAGTGENFLGILNTPGIGAAGAPGAGESAIDQVRKARRLVQVDGRVNPNAVVLNPTDAQKIDLLKVNNEANHMLRDPFAPSGQMVIYGMPVVETTAIPAGTGLVGDFRKAILFDRESVAISLGTVADDFIRNIVRVLGELRAGFTVARSKAFATFVVP